jgi:hypothetical protein
MPATYEKIATTTLGSANANITFTSIGSGYTDLRLVMTFLSSSGSITSRLRFNGDTGSNYSSTTLRADGSSASSDRGTGSIWINPFNSTATTTIPLMVTYDIFSYAGSTFKSLLMTTSGDQNGSGWVERIVGLYRSTSAITSISIDASASTFAAGSTATLYGILKA